jgi:hypothetical protein
VPCIYTSITMLTTLSLSSCGSTLLHNCTIGSAHSSLLVCISSTQAGGCHRAWLCCAADVHELAVHAVPV